MLKITLGADIRQPKYYVMALETNEVVRHFYILRDDSQKPYPSGIMDKKDVTAFRDFLSEILNSEDNLNG
jgi:hypothetical protein